MVRAMLLSRAKLTSASISITSMATFSSLGSIAVPALPGATNTRSTAASLAAVQASACSRPPEPITRIFMCSILLSMTVLVTEMAHASEDHGQAMLVGGIDHFLIAHGATRLVHCGDTGCCGGIDAITEGEEGIGRHHGARYLQTFVRSLDAGDLGGVDAAHLAGADTDGLTVLGIDDGVGFDVLGHFPAEQQITNLLFGGLALGDDLQLRRIDHAQITVLYQQATVDTLVVKALRTLAFPLAALKQTHIGLGSDNVRGFLGYARSDDHFHELAIHDRLGGLAVQLAVEGDDAAKRRSGVGLEGAVVGFQNIVAHRHATGVGVLDDDTGRFLERLDTLQSRIGIRHVVERQLLALQLAR